MGGDPSVGTEAIPDELCLLMANADGEAVPAVLRLAKAKSKADYKP